MGQITVSKCYTEDGVEIEGLKVIEPKVFGDSRGYFTRSIIIMIMRQQE